MRAAVMIGGEIKVRDMPDPRPESGYSLVKPAFAGICGSDLHLREILKSLAEITPQEQHELLPKIVPGHEFSAEIVDFGPNTTSDFKIGDRIVPLPFLPSSETGVDSMGLGYETIGLSPSYPGGLSTLSVVDPKRCYRVPQSVPMDHAALTEPLAVGLHAVNLASRNKTPNIVIGCGPVGLAVILALKAQGRDPILAADFSATRRQAAEAFGADIVIDPAASSPYEKWEDLHFEHPLPSPILEKEIRDRPESTNIFECVGAPGIIDQIIKNAPQHSHIIVSGVCPHEDKYTPQDGIVRELTLEYSFAYRPCEFEDALRMIEESPDLVTRMITSRLSLNETQQAFDQLSTNPRQVKVLINPQEG